MNLLRVLEKKLSAVMGGLVKRVVGPPEPLDCLEIQQAILADVEAHIVSGSPEFPFNDLRVVVRASAGIPPAMPEPQKLENEVIEALRRAGCAVPRRFRITIESENPPAAGEGSPPFEVRYGNHQDDPFVVRNLPAAVLTVVAGQAAPPVYQVSSRRVNLGRLAYVTAPGNRLIRRNDVAFTDTADAVNVTVAREHAHIEFDAQVGRYRLYDDTLTGATAVIRRDEFLRIPSIGLELKPGDDIRLGRAAIRFEQPSDAPPG